MIRSDKSLPVTVLSVQKLPDLRLTRLFPGIAGHFIFLLQKPQGSER
jgi:hypothetical protein